MMTDHRLQINHFESFRLRFETPKARSAEVLKHRRAEVSKSRSRFEPSDSEDKWNESVDSR
jgi:hypothetical protein